MLSPNLGLSDAELLAVGREVHGMFHAGASKDDALARLRTRLSRGRYDELPRLLRPMFSRFTKQLLDSTIWGADHCGHDHEIVICDEPKPAD